MKIIKYVIMLFLALPSLILSITVDILNNSRDPVLVSSNFAKTEYTIDPKYPSLRNDHMYDPMVYPAEDRPEHYTTANKPPVPARHAKPTTYILEAKSRDDFFYFSTNRGIFTIDRAKDVLGKSIWIVRQRYVYGSKDIKQYKDLATYTEDQVQKIKKIIITIYQNTETSVEPKL